MMRSMFKMPKAPKPAKMPAEQPTPTIDQAAQQAEEQNRMRRRKGRGAYMLNRQSTGAGSPAVATKTLTGQ